MKLQNKDRLVTIQTLIPEYIVDAVREDAKSNYKYLSSYFRRWIINGYMDEFSEVE